MLTWDYRGGSSGWTINDMLVRIVPCHFHLDRRGGRLTGRFDLDQRGHLNMLLEIQSKHQRLLATALPSS